MFTCRGARLHRSPPPAEVCKKQPKISARHACKPASKHREEHSQSSHAVSENTRCGAALSQGKTGFRIPLLFPEQPRTSNGSAGLLVTSREGWWDMNYARLKSRFSPCFHVNDGAPLSWGSSPPLAAAGMRPCCKITPIYEYFTAPVYSHIHALFGGETELLFVCSSVGGEAEFLQNTEIPKLLLLLLVRHASVTRASTKRRVCVCVCSSSASSSHPLPVSWPSYLRAAPSSSPPALPSLSVPLLSSRSKQSALSSAERREDQVLCSMSPLRASVRA